MADANTQDIAVFGGSFNPPGLHHRAMAETLARAFGRVLVLPCGFRPDKPGAAGWLARGFRRRLVELAFEGLEGLEFDWSDLHRERFTPTVELAARYQGRGALWFVAGADLFAGGKDGRSPIQAEWQEGPRIWRELNWACLTRPGVAFDPADLPPRHRLLEFAVPGSSSEIRRRLVAGESIDALVAPGVAALLHGLQPALPWHPPQTR
jgi:nicotinic acid mononucleotide adenylyltransferase